MFRMSESSVARRRETLTAEEYARSLREDPDLTVQIELLVRRRRAMKDHIVAAVKLRDAVTPQVAAATQAHENVVRDIEEEFGLLTSNQVATVMGSKNTSRSFASDLRKAGKLLYLERLNTFRYPGFQFDDRGRILPVVAPLIRLAGERGWDVEDATLWTLSATRYLHGDRPVDRLGDPEAVLAAAKGAWGSEW